jgi:hypothetical protein
VIAPTTRWRVAIGTAIAERGRSRRMISRCRASRAVETSVSSVTSGMMIVLRERSTSPAGCGELQSGA